MKNKKIVVCLKYFKGELNPFDGAALECAIESGAKDITAVTMSPPSAKSAFQSLTRLGVKCLFVSDPAYAGSDTQATSYILSETIKRLNPDLVFCGRQSVDGDTAQVPPMLAQRMGYAIQTKVMAFNGERVTLRGGETLIPQDKTVLTFEKIRTLRFPSIFSKLGEVETWDNGVLRLPMEKCGIKGSPTRVVKSYESTVGRRNCRFFPVEKLGELIEQALKKPRVENLQERGEKLKKAYFVGNVKTIAESVADEAIEFKIEDKTPEAIAQALVGQTVLWEDSDKLKVLASQTAVLCGAGLCADCISFRIEKGRLIMTRPALGGNITADIVCESDTAFATVRTVKREGSEVIFSVGKGAVEQIEKIKEFAQKYGAEVCCSRIVADSGKLPYEKQVGLTGRTVCPKVYVAFGISGAVQHTCAIAGANTVIAVNTNKQERIFDYADYGIIAEAKDVKL